MRAGLKAAPVSAAIVCAALAGALPVHAQSAQERAQMDRIFAQVDVDRDGTISRGEFDTFMRQRFEAQRAEFEAAFTAADENGDGVIDRKEAAINAVLLEKFDSVDRDGDGKISRDELRAALAALAGQSASL